MRQRILAGFLFVFCAVAGASKAPAATATFAPRLEAGGVPLVLWSQGTLRARVFFTVYAAALYLGEGVAPGRWAEDVPKRLEIHYFYSIPPSVMIEEGQKALERQVPAARLPPLGPRLDRINAAYVEVRPGDRYALTYLPARGTELSLNGRPVVTIEGADFAAAYFGIWLGHSPASRPLRDALLAPKKSLPDR